MLGVVSGVTIRLIQHATISLVQSIQCYLQHTRTSPDIMTSVQGNVRGRGRSNEGGLSQAFQGGRHNSVHGGRAGAHGR